MTPELEHIKSRWESNNCAGDSVCEDAQADIVFLLAKLDRAYEALNALSTDLSTLKSGVGDLVVKYRLGAYMAVYPDAMNAVIRYGLGEQDPDPSVMK